MKAEDRSGLVDYVANHYAFPRFSGPGTPGDNLWRTVPQNAEARPYAISQSAETNAEEAVAVPQVRTNPFSDGTLGLSSPYSTSYS
jgi:hypothetical protein